jgi:hypothetical protein
VPIPTTLQIRCTVEFLEKIIAYGKDENILDDRTGQVSKSASALRLIEIAFMIIETRKLDLNNSEEFKQTVDEFTKKRKLDGELEWINSLTEDQLVFLQTGIKEKRDKNYKDWVNKTK